MANNKQDLLEKAIADAKKIPQVAMEAAKKQLVDTYSKDFRKLYRQQINEMSTGGYDASGGGDFDYGAILDEEDESLSQDLGGEGGMPPMDDPMGGGGAPGGDMGGGEMGGMPGEDPMGGAPAGGMPPPPGGGGPESPLMDQVPGTEEGDPVQGIKDQLTSLMKKVDELMDRAQEGIDPNDDSLVFDPADFESGEDQVEDVMGAEAQMGAPLPGQDTPMGGEEDPGMGMEAPEEEDPFRFESIEINDELLLEYIEKALTSEKLIGQLSKDMTQLKESNEKILEALSKSNESVKTLQKQNSKLVYQNKALVDVSLSEHQKRYIVEALEKAKTVNEAKQIYETAKNLPRKPAPPAKATIKQALTDSRVLGGASTSTILVKEATEPKATSKRGISVDQAIADRFKELAGLKKTS